MQPTAGVREHAQAIELLELRIFRDFKGLLILPETLGYRLDFRRIVRAVLHGAISIVKTDPQGYTSRHCDRTAITATKPAEPID